VAIGPPRTLEEGHHFRSGVEVFTNYDGARIGFAIKQGSAQTYSPRGAM
jgi:hypothetical protein